MYVGSDFIFNQISMLKQRWWALTINVVSSLIQRWCVSWVTFSFDPRTCQLSLKTQKEKIIYFKINLKKSSLIQNTILDSFSEFLNFCNMYFGPLHFANHLRKYLYNICYCKFAKWNDSFKITSNMELCFKQNSMLKFVIMNF